MASFYKEALHVFHLFALLENCICIWYLSLDYLLHTRVVKLITSKTQLESFYA